MLGCYPTDISVLLNVQLSTSTAEEALCPSWITRKHRSRLRGKSVMFSFTITPAIHWAYSVSYSHDNRLGGFRNPHAQGRITSTRHKAIILFLWIENWNFSLTILGLVWLGAKKLTEKIVTVLGPMINLIARKIMCLNYKKEDKGESIRNLADSQVFSDIIPSNFPILHFHTPISILMEN